MEGQELRPNVLDQVNLLGTQYINNEKVIALANEFDISKEFVAGLVDVVINQPVVQPSKNVEESQVVEEAKTVSNIETKEVESSKEAEKLSQEDRVHLQDWMQHTIQPSLGKTGNSDMNDEEVLKERKEKQVDQKRADNAKTLAERVDDVAQNLTSTEENAPADEPERADSQEGQEFSNVSSGNSVVSGNSVGSSSSMLRPKPPVGY